MEKYVAPMIEIVILSKDDILVLSSTVNGKGSLLSFNWEEKVR